MSYQTLVDDTTTPWTTYICKADLWRATTEAQWQIVAIDSDWNKKYPSDSNDFPSDKFEFIADDRASLVYSYTWI